MTAIEDFLKANESYAATFQKGDLPMPPARHVAVLTCMDARYRRETRGRNPFAFPGE